MIGYIYDGIGSTLEFKYMVHISDDSTIVYSNEQVDTTIELIFDQNVTMLHSLPLAYGKNLTERDLLRIEHKWFNVWGIITNLEYGVTNNIIKCTFSCKGDILRNEMFIDKLKVPDTKQLIMDQFNTVYTQEPIDLIITDDLRQADNIEAPDKNLMICQVINDWYNRGFKSDAYVNLDTQRLEVHVDSYPSTIAPKPINFDGLQDSSYFFTNTGFTACQCYYRTDDNADAVYAGNVYLKLDLTWTTDSTDPDIVQPLRWTTYLWTRQANAETVADMKENSFYGGYALLNYRSATNHIDFTADLNDYIYRDYIFNDYFNKQSNKYDLFMAVGDYYVVSMPDGRKVTTWISKIEVTNNTVKIIFGKDKRYVFDVIMERLTKGTGKITYGLTTSGHSSTDLLASGSNFSNGMVINVANEYTGYSKLCLCLTDQLSVITCDLPGIEATVLRFGGIYYTSGSGHYTHAAHLNVNSSTQLTVSAFAPGLSHNASGNHGAFSTASFNWWLYGVV